MDEKKEKKKKKKKKGNTGKEIVNDGNTIDIDMKWLEQYQDRNLAAEYLKNTEPVDLAWYAVFNKAFCEQKTTPEHDRRIEQVADYCSNLFDPFYPTSRLSCDSERYIEARNAYIDSIAYKLPVGDDDDTNGNDSIMEVESQPHQSHLHSSSPILLHKPFPIRPLDKREEKCRIRSTENKLVLKFTLKNTVRVTYLYNKDTKQPYTINLCALGKNMLPYFVEHSRKKFSKINLRYLGGGSHLIYASGIIVETGSNNEANSLYLLEHTFNILRTECHLTNVVIQKRECCNIVAHGSIRGGILCLATLQSRYTWTQKKEPFIGVIITVEDMENHYREDDFSNMVNNTQSDSKSKNDVEFSFVPSYNNKENDYDEMTVISRINGDAPMLDVKIEKDRLSTLEDFFSGTENNKGTFLVFKDQVICAGCKPMDRLRLSCERLHRILQPCIIPDK
jgi:TATA-box binding protein (TBP) (component of TFIID and TFIIIB)